MKTLLLAGTKKGLFVFTSTDRHDWQLHGPFQTGREINHAIYDSRSGRIYTTSNDAWFGCEIVWSSDLGESWAMAKQNPGFAESAGMKLERIWHIEPGRPGEPQVLYAGVAPAALFRSEDGGKNWEVANKGTRAEFLPEKYPEFGQCVHKLLLADSKSSLLFQQNHCGVYRSADGGRNWQEITAGLPSDFGFPLAIHPREPETIFVLPLKGAEFRCPPEGRLRVYRSRNSGKSWEALSKGLPQQN